MISIFFPGWPCIDLCLVIDSSAAINSKDPNNWNTLKHFLKDLVIRTTQTDRPINLQLSAITFAETPREEFLFSSTAPLSDYSTMQYMGQDPANVNRGLMLARERGFTGGRPGVPRVVLLLTQGIKPEFNHYVEEAENNAYNEANLLRSEGVRLLAVGASQSPGMVYI